MCGAYELVIYRALEHHQLLIGKIIHKTGPCSIALKRNRRADTTAKSHELPQSTNHFDNIQFLRGSRSWPRFTLYFSELAMCFLAVTTCATGTQRSVRKCLRALIY